MDKPSGQAERPEASRGRRPGAAATRIRLLEAAAQLIAEVGWGRVTTRAVAERAGLPHGAVSYHFRGKQELLADSALHAFAEALPADTFAAMTSLTQMLALIRTELGTPEEIDPVLSRLMMETMREAERDPRLQQRMGEMLRSYRALTADLIHREQERGTVAETIPAEGLAILLAAVGDGLLMHVLFDPDLDVMAAIDALEVLVRAAAAPG